MRATLWIALLLLSVSAVGCQSAPARSADPSATAPAVSTGDFSGDAAFAHLRALAAIGPRVAGTPGAARARAYLRGELEKLGLSVEERRIAEATGPDGTKYEMMNLIAVIPGASPDLFVLAAPYDTRRFDTFEFVGANDGASAPALLLELARLIQARPLPYTTWIVFLDGEAPLAAGADAEPAYVGSKALASELLPAAGAPPVRLIVLFQQVGDADLHVTRDLRSHRLFRDEFWFAAARLGHKDAFRADDPFESPRGSHLPFLAAGFRGVVLITDDAFGSGEPPGAFANSEDDTPKRCSPQSLASVGAVTLETLDSISARLAKIDRFSRPPPAPDGTPTQAPPPNAPPAPSTTPAPSASPAPSATPAPSAPPPAPSATGAAPQPTAAPPAPAADASASAAPPPADGAAPAPPPSAP